MGLCGYKFEAATTPLIMFWFMSYLIYTLQIFVAQELEKTANIKNVIIGFIMYFTYAQLFIVILVRGLYLYIKSKIRHEFIAWDKTKRVKIEE